MVPRGFLVPALALLAGALAAAAPARPAAIAIAPARTSIYIGRITLTLPPLPATPTGYAGTYAARVFPYFFYDEQGTFTLDAGEAEFRELAAGHPVAFHGHARSSAAEDRLVEGTATPAGATTGKIKVRIHVSARIQLIFNTTYTLLPAAGTR